MTVGDQQPLVPDKKTQPKAVAVDNGRTKRSLSKLMTSKRNLLYIILLLILIAGTWVILKDVFRVGEKVYAQAAGHKIYKEDIDLLIGDTKGVSTNNAATVLANKYLYEAMVKQAGLTVTNKDITARYPDSDSATTQYARQVNVNNVYYNKLLAYNQGLYKGKVLVANFSRNIAFQSPYIGMQQALNPLLGNEAAIAADKQYAHNLIDKLYGQIKSGQITFDQAIKAEHEDPVVGEKAYQTLPHSGMFDTSNVLLPATSLLAPKSIESKLASMKAGELSTPFAVTVPNSWIDKNITTESYYLVVQMDYTKGSQSGLSFDKYLAKAKKQYGYKVNK